MGNIDRLNKELDRKMQSVVAGGKDAKNHKLDKYIKALNENKKISVCFDAVDMEGNFTHIEDGVMLMLTGQSVSNYGSRTNPYATSRLLGITMQLSVRQVLQDENKVLLELPPNGSISRQQAIRNAINREIAKNLSEGHNPVLWGKVVKIQDNRAVVDLLNQGVMGKINVSKWQKSYTRNLESVCSEGEYYQFEVTGKIPSQNKTMPAWRLSRTSLTEDAWSALDLDALQVGGVLIVKCVEKPEGKTYWWGVSDRTPGIEVMGDYRNIDMYVGISYLCKIKDIDIKDDGVGNMFKVVPFDIAPVDKEKMAAVNRFKKTKEA